MRKIRDSACRSRRGLGVDGNPANVDPEADARKAESPAGPEGAAGNRFGDSFKKRRKQQSPSRTIAYHDHMLSCSMVVAASSVSVL